MAVFWTCDEMIEDSDCGSSSDSSFRNSCKKTTAKHNNAYCGSLDKIDGVVACGRGGVVREQQLQRERDLLRESICPKPEPKSMEATRESMRARAAEAMVNI